MITIYTVPAKEKLLTTSWLNVMEIMNVQMEVGCTQFAPRSSKIRVRMN